MQATAVYTAVSTKFSTHLNLASAVSVIDLPRYCTAVYTYTAVAVCTQPCEQKGNTFPCSHSRVR